jgi:hypothetical protein
MGKANRSRKEIRILTMPKLNTTPETPRTRLERFERILWGITTPARHEACLRLRFVIDKILEGEPTDEQATGVMRELIKIILYS